MFLAFRMQNAKAGNIVLSSLLQKRVSCRSGSRRTGNLFDQSRQLVYIEKAIRRHLPMWKVRRIAIYV